MSLASASAPIGLVRYSTTGARRALDAGIAGDDRDLAVRGEIDVLDQVEAVAVRQIQIDHQQIELIVRRELARGAQRARAGDLAARELGELAYERLEVHVVVNDQDVSSGCGSRHAEVPCELFSS